MTAPLTLFPPYLNQGSKGPAVTTLQVVLKAMGLATEGLIPDGDYGDETAVSVRALQTRLGFDEDAQDGHFGPDTRRAAQGDMFHGFDFDSLRHQAFQGRTKWIGPEGEGTWPVPGSRSDTSA